MPARDFAVGVDIRTPDFGVHTVLEEMDRAMAVGGRDVRKVDVSKPANRQFAAQHGVRGTPTRVFIDEEGTEVSRLIGAVDFDAVHGAVAVLMGEVCADFTAF